MRPIKGCDPDGVECVLDEFRGLSPTAIQVSSLRDFGAVSSCARFTARWKILLDGIAGLGEYSATKPNGAFMNKDFKQTALVAALVLSGFSSICHAQSPLLDSFNPDVSSAVQAIAQQTDGKLLIGGSFTTLNGEPRNRIARLNEDGTLDATFNAGTDRVVTAIAIQDDGKIVLGGSFTVVTGQTRRLLARLNPDGSLDNDFNPGVGHTETEHVRSLAIQADGKILVAGEFNWVADVLRRGIARLNQNGTLDTNFNPAANNGLYCVAVQADGKILVGGAFRGIGGKPRLCIARLDSDGIADNDFHPDAEIAGGSPGYAWVWTVAALGNGQVLLGGDFDTVAGQPRSHIARLNSNGSLDLPFDPGADDRVVSFGSQADGKIVIGGEFKMAGGQSRTNLARLNVNGSLDAGFNPILLPDSPTGVAAVGIQTNGMLLIGGSFTDLNGQVRKNVGRFNVTDPTTNSLTASGDTLSWQRGGSSPEFWRAKFQYSTNGTTWYDLGGGEFTPGGWQWRGLYDLPTCTIRARGYITGGRYNGSSWYEERMLEYVHQTPIRIVTNDGGFGMNTNQFGFNVTGESNQVLVIECTTNLLDWLPLQTNTVTGDTFYFSDPAWSQAVQRFYRARLWP